MMGARYAVVLLMLLGSTGVLLSRGDTDRVPVSAPLSEMPEQIGSWHGSDIAIADDVLAILGKGDFLNRIYSGGTADAVNHGVTPISLFIGYFATQRTGQAIHSPQNCLPGAGWTFQSSRYGTLKADDGRSVNVGEYVIANGESKQFVLYWYQAHGRSIPNEYVSKAYMVADAMRLRRTDGAIVRVITMIAPNETQDEARERVFEFTAQVAPMLPRFIPN